MGMAPAPPPPAIIACCISRQYGQVSQLGCMTWPLGHTLPCCFLSLLRKGRMRSSSAKNTVLVSSGRLVEPELEHVDVPLGGDGLGGHLQRVVGDEGAGHQEVVVPPAVLAVGLGHLPLAHLLAVHADVADLLAEDGVEALDHHQILAGLEVVDLPLGLSSGAARRCDDISTSYGWHTQ